ncbi:MAG: hypothetical protein KKE50_03310 [Nanoarchaeota archaeon]|nr:hypothetical protein [Nanoarchaeota archaeon]
MAKAKMEVEEDQVLIEEEKEEAKKEVRGTRYSCTYSPKYATTRKKAGTTYSPKY